MKLTISNIAFYTLLCLFLTLFKSNVYAQGKLSNLVEKKLEIVDSITIIDSLSIVPNSFKIVNQPVDSNLFSVNHIKSTIFWKGEFPNTIEVQYRVFPIDFNHTYVHKDTSKMQVADNLSDGFKFYAKPEASDIFDMGNLSRSGSISRGVMFGNNQDLSINSNLNLELAGRITDEISILASITDDNLPIQPEGNTEQLQDFDQVFIQLFSDNWKLTAGDFWMKNRAGYFLRYNKRGQGGSFETTRQNIFGSHKNSALIKSKLSSKISGAISKGKFARNTLIGIEGNQGPYKLIGDENEQFIIVLSGTERVYIDGKLLVRGQDNDYVIDYNTSEVTFTPKQLITKDKRIVVEFQYSDKNYARSIVESINVLEVDKWKIHLGVYSEQDSKNQPLQQELKSSEKDILFLAGDDLLNAVAPSADSVGFNTDQVLYKKIDSLGTQIFVQSSDSDSAFYQVSFSNVGAGNGNYVEDEFGAFGRVFKWVAPDTVAGILDPQGSYEPVKVLVSPKKRQMFTFGVERKLSKNSSLSTEVAYTNKDINTFSILDADDNEGYGAKLELKINQPMNKLWKFKSKVAFEMQSQNFNRIERYRDVEFERDWNVLALQSLADQYMGVASAGVEHRDNGKVNVSFGTYQITDLYSGYKNGLKVDWKKGVRAKIDASFLQTNGANNTSFLRHKADISKSLGFMRIGYKDDHEQNLFHTGDSLWGNSYQYYDWEVYAQSPDSSINKFRVFYKERTDRLAKSNSISRATNAKNPGVSFELNKNKNHRVRVRSMLRSLTILDSSLTAIKPDNTLLNRLEYNLRMLKGGIKLSSFYEIGSGLELKKQFAYIEVPAGQGIYTWVDYNDDGVKDLNEFEIAAFPDQATYIRVFTPSNEYVKVFSNQFNESLSINPRFFIKSKKGFLSFVKRFNTQTSMRKERKTSLQDFREISNPFLTNIADTALRSLTSSFRNSSYFNRSNPKFGIEHTFISSQLKLLLVNGFDSRDRKSNQLKFRWNFTRKLMIQLEGEEEFKLNTSDYAPTRNFELRNRMSEVKLTVQPSTTLRASLLANYKEKLNAKDLGGEQAFITNVGLELRYNQLKKGSVNANFNYVQIHYVGSANTSVAFEMLEALQPGSNFTWNLSYQRTLANNLQVSLNYTGRKTEENRPIHTGGVQVRAFF